MIALPMKRSPHGDTGQLVDIPVSGLQYPLPGRTAQMLIRLAGFTAPRRTLNGRNCR
jgi:hypothetical protein